MKNNKDLKNPYAYVDGNLVSAESAERGGKF